VRARIHAGASEKINYKKELSTNSNIDPLRLKAKRAKIEII
jgi:hypothetical protein